MIPKPFARVAVAVGKPIEVPRTLPANQLESARDEVQTAMESLLAEARARVS